MRIHESEKPLAEWLAANYPGALKAYESYVGVNLGEVYFLDLRGWLRRGRPGVLAEYAEALAPAVRGAKALFADIKAALQKFDGEVEANPNGGPMLGSECWMMAQDITVRALNWKGWLGKGLQALPICDDWLERIFHGLD